jgi:hypothetical protein
MKKIHLLKNGGELGWTFPFGNFFVFCNFVRIYTKKMYISKAFSFLKKFID